jgi:ABC-type branched-subunit amino acid transport system substrate-binding protein
VVGFVSSFAAAGSAGSTARCFDPKATPVTIGANWALTGSSNAATADQVDVVKHEINRGCGIRLGSAHGGLGSPLAIPVRDNTNTAAGAAAVTSQLIAAGAVAVVGGAASTTGPPAALAAVQANVPFGANQAAADSMSGCTAAELADAAVTKSSVPVYGAGKCWDNHGLVFRTAATGNQFGTTAARYARETYPTATNAAIVYRDDDFGRPDHDGLHAKFVELGGTVSAETGIVESTSTVASLKTVLKTITAGNPSLILGGINTTFRNFMQAYVELRDDPTWTTKPSNFDTLKFVWAATLSGSYSDVSSAVRSVLVNQSVFVQPAWDPTSAPYQRWFALYRSVNPNAQAPTNAFYMSAYDAMVVMSLAIVSAGTTSGPAVAAQLRRVANPPGKVVCPGQWRKAVRLLAAGADINYEGASGPVDLDERGNATGIAFGIFKVQPDASTALVGTFGAPATQPQCPATPGAATYTGLH